MLRRHDRQQEIVTKLRAKGMLSVMGLAEELGVSDETIRRELRVLETEGVVVRLHGAVRLAPPAIEGPLDRRMQENAEAKMRIATAATAYISDGDILFIDSGTTSCYVAKALGNHNSLTVITNSLTVAEELGGINGNQLFLAGGQMDYNYRAFSDRTAQEFVAGFTPHLAILSVGAVHAEHGLMDFHAGEAAMSRIAYATSQRVLLGADASKFGRFGMMSTAALRDVDILVTDQPLDPDYAAAFVHAEVVIA
jgi:DeoR family glycerol-3-phosphate regulon repressor